jgi:hypothetical protein
MSRDVEYRVSSGGDDPDEFDLHGRERSTSNDGKQNLVFTILFWFPYYRRFA